MGLVFTLRNVGAFFILIVYKTIRFKWEKILTPILKHFRLTSEHTDSPRIRINIYFSLEKKFTDCLR